MVKKDNTFPFKSRRYQAPAPLRNKRITIRFNRHHTEQMVVYFKDERLGSARHLDAVANGLLPRGDTEVQTMIHSCFGIQQIPFSQENIELMPQQRELFHILMVHAVQGGLCLLMDEPGTGKSLIKEAILQRGDKRQLEKSLIEAALGLYRSGRSLVIIIDDDHLVEMETLRRIRPLLEECPKNHNLILAGETEPLSRMTLSVNSDIRSRLTYSTILGKLASSG